MNRIVLIGKLVATPEIKQTDAAGKFAVLKIATTEKWTDQQGVKHTRTDQHRVVVFRKHSVDFIENHLKKAARIFVEGKLENHKLVQDDGTEINVSQVMLSQRGPGAICCLQSGANKQKTDDFTDNDVVSDVADYSLRAYKIGRGPMFLEETRYE